MVDTTQTLEIYNSRRRLLSFAALSAVMTAGGVWLAVGPFADVRPSWIGTIIGYASTVFFGFCTVALLRRAATSDGPIVIITPVGIQDKRIAADPIPWTIINKISTWRFGTASALVFAVDPEDEVILALTPLAKRARGPNRALGADGHCITADGLQISHDDFLKIALAYWEAARQRSTTSA